MKFSCECFQCLETFYRIFPSIGSRQESTGATQLINCVEVTEPFACGERVAHKATAAEKEHRNGYGFS